MYYTLYRKSDTYSLEKSFRKNDLSIRFYNSSFYLVKYNIFMIVYQRSLNITLYHLMYIIIQFQSTLLQKLLLLLQPLHLWIVSQGGTSQLLYFRSTKVSRSTKKYKNYRSPLYPPCSKYIGIH
jgi:hypothetical protein